MIKSSLDSTNLLCHHNQLLPEGSQSGQISHDFTEGYQDLKVTAVDCIRMSIAVAATAKHPTGSISKKW